MNNHDQEVEWRLNQLMCLLSDRDSRDSSTLEKDNNTFIIKYPNTKKGFECVKKILNTLQAGDFLNNEEMPILDTNKPIKEIIGNYSIKINAELTLKIAEEDSTILFTLPKNTPRKNILNGLDAAINSAESQYPKPDRILLKKSPIIKMPTEPDLGSIDLIKATKSSIYLSPEVDAVLNYLTKKVENEFPDSNVKTTYSAPNAQTSNGAFMLIFDHKTGEDLSAFNNFKSEVLDKIFPKKNTFMFNVNAENSQIGLNVSGNPAFLIKLIEKNDPDNFLHIEKQPALTR